jgi:nucleoside 2-deoxyribosyltransferase
VILPQDEAKQYIKGNKVDAKAIAEHCFRQSVQCDVMIAILDGPDSDSGTSLEAGLRIGQRRALKCNVKVIGVRTDFRRSEDRHVNAMFRLLDAVVFFRSTNEDPTALCGKIHVAIRRLNGVTIPSKKKGRFVS